MVLVVLVSNVPRGKMFTRGRETSEKFNIGATRGWLDEKQPRKIEIAGCTGTE